MNRTRSAWLSTALLCAALLAGCGNSSTTTTSSTPAAATQPAATSTSTSTAPAATTPTTSTPTKTASTPNGPGSVAKRLATTVCKSSAARANLKGKLKVRIEEICHAYEHGDEAKAREAAKKACVEAVESIPTQSPAKKQALARCEAS